MKQLTSMLSLKMLYKLTVPSERLRFYLIFSYTVLPVFIDKVLTSMVSRVQLEIDLECLVDYLIFLKLPSEDRNLSKLEALHYRKQKTFCCVTFICN